MKKSRKGIKRIGIDARFYGSLGKGLGRYTQEVVDNVVALDQENEYVIFLSRENFEEFKSESKRVKKVLAPIKWYTLSEQMLFPFYIWREHLDLMHFPHFNVPLLAPVKFIVTIHDLILIKYPTLRATTLNPFFYKIKNLAYGVVIRMAVRRAKKIIAVSNFTKNDILENFSLKAEKVEVIYEGVAQFNQRFGDNDEADTKELLSYNINKKFLLYVGNAYPHKNLEGLIKVFSSVYKKNPDLSLVLVGKEDYFYKRLKEIAKINWPDVSPILFLGYVSDKNLKILYKKALAYIFPSFYEGFGLPPIEAMAHGCPVVSSNTSSMPEVLGEAALYFEPDNEIEMQKKIEEIMESEDLRRDLIGKGLKQAGQYDWKVCAKKTLAIYRAV